MIVEQGQSSRAVIEVAWEGGVFRTHVELSAVPVDAAAQVAERVAEQAAMGVDLSAGTVRVEGLDVGAHVVAMRERFRPDVGKGV